MLPVFDKLENMNDSLEKPYWFHKDKCPQGVSFPLKRSNLDSALIDSGVYGAVYSVRYLATRNRVLLEAAFSPLGSRAHEDVIGRSLLTIWAVSSDHRHPIEEQMTSLVLPLLCKWLQQTQTQGGSWRSMRHNIGFRLDMDGVIRAIEDQA